MAEERYQDRKIYSLSDVGRSLQSVISKQYRSEFYVKAEISKLNFYPHSGHCYPDLVEKVDGRVIAQMRANLWRDDYQRIADEFRRSTGNELGDGLEVLCLASLGYHPSYGLSITIRNIVPEYNLGAMALARQHAIERLEKENLWDANRQKPFPLLPKHVAVISVSTSKGYQDFMNILSERRFPLNTYLFPALLQGDQAVASILEALARVERAADQFDAVAIVRGGGGDIGLSCYDHYDLAQRVAAFPLPIVTGIGHSTNRTVTEMVAFYAAITPTDTANFFVEQQERFAQTLEDLQQQIVALSRQKIDEAYLALQNYGHRFQFAGTEPLRRRREQLAQLRHRTHLAAQEHLNRVQHGLQLAQERLRLLDPQQVLQRGYSLTYHDHQLLKHIETLHPGDQIETQLAQGRIQSQVISVASETIEPID